MDITINGINQTVFIKTIEELGTLKKNMVIRNFEKIYPNLSYGEKPYLQIVYYITHIFSRVQNIAIYNKSLNCHKFMNLFEHTNENFRLHSHGIRTQSVAHQTASDPTTKCRSTPFVCL